MVQPIINHHDRIRRSTGSSIEKRYRTGRKRTRIIIRTSYLALCACSLIPFTICFPVDVSRSKSMSKTMPVQSSLQQVLLPSSSSTSQSLSQSQSQSPKKKNKINSDTNITITNVQQQRQQRQLLPLRTIEYRRRKHEWAKRYTSQQGLREAFGSNRNKFWGDLDARTARRLYKKLLFPTALSELILELGDDVIRPEELSPLAYEARKAAKLYVRERCRVPSRVGAYLFDGIRQFRKHGKFQMDGVTYEQLWIRYYHDHDIDDHDDDGGFGSLLFGHDDDDDIDDDVNDDIDDAVTEEQIIMRTCQKILEKSYTTNEAIDRFYLKKYNETKEQQGEYNNNSNSNSNISINDDDNDDNYKTTIKDRIVRGGRTQQRWRRRRGRVDRYNDLLLERITNTLERDVRKLLLSYSSPSENEDDIVNHRLRDEEGIGIDNEYDNRNNINNNNSNNKDNEMLSSRRMTQQEYHSLKLFAKARKYSQQQQKLSIDTTKAVHFSDDDDDDDDDYSSKKDIISLRGGEIITMQYSTSVSR